MTSQREHIDEFESMFRRAEREPFGYAEIPLRTVAVVTDGTDAEAEAVVARMTEFAPRLATVENWRRITRDDYTTVTELLAKIDEEQTDLIVTHRHLGEESLAPQHSLGVYLDVMTQRTAIPVLVLPQGSHPVGRCPRAWGPHSEALKDRICNRVMVVTDHITGDHRLINYGLRMCADGGTVWLCHVEDDSVFERYMNVISRIPEIETDVARELLGKQLLKEAADFIKTCIKTLQKKKPELNYESVVTFGHHLKEYRRLIDDHNADLLVANTKDDDQLAMHGMTYSLSVELLDIPLLLL